MRVRKLSVGLCLGVMLAGAVGASAARADDVRIVRFATFNASLERAADTLIDDLATGQDPQARAVAEIIQRVDPDVLLLNEFDFDPDGEALRLFRERYLEVSQSGAAPIEFRYAFLAPSNTGIPSGFDLDNDGTIGGPNDAFGFGVHPGHFGMAILSKHPILDRDARTFARFLWRDMPGARLPDDASTPAPMDFYSADELAVFRLSSKSHWDVPIAVYGRVIHVLASHPTPPVFDGPEDRNGRRNADEIRLFADYLSPFRSTYLVDDQGRRGGLRGNDFVVMGDQNADPRDGDSTDDAVLQLLRSRFVHTRVTPSSRGGVAATLRQGDNNLSQRGNPAFDTADFAESEFGGPGNLRADYVLPSRTLPIVRAQVFWPTENDPLFRLVGDFPFPSSDHRLVSVDVVVAPPRDRGLSDLVRALLVRALAAADASDG